MMNLLSLFTGSWKKSEHCRAGTCPARRSRTCRPAPPADQPLRNGSGCLPTTSGSWPEAWRTGCASTAAVAGWGRRGSCWRR